MKKTILLFLLAFIGLSTANAQVGIGTIEPDPSSVLDVTSTEKGLLPPRLTTDQRDEINLPDGPTPGLVIYNKTVNCLQWFNGTGWFDACDGTITGPPISTGACAGEPEVFTFNGKIYSPVESSGRCWLDRNLGASAVTSTPRSDYTSYALYEEAESASFGDLYQWGRVNDGHQIRTSPVTEGPVTAGTEGNYFFFNDSGTFDWLSTQDATRWGNPTDTDKGIHDPCPSGYRIPTKVELIDDEMGSWTTTDSDGAFESPLKLSMGNYRDSSTGIIAPGSTAEANCCSSYWTSTIDGDVSNALVITYPFLATGLGVDLRASGNSVRCIKN